MMSLPDTGTVAFMIACIACVPHIIKGVVYLRVDRRKAQAEEGRSVERRVERRKEFNNLSGTVRSQGTAIEDLKKLLRDEVRALETLIREKNELDNARYLEFYREMMDRIAELGSRINARGR